MHKPGLAKDASMSVQIASEPDLLTCVLYEQSPVVNVMKF